MHIWKKRRSVALATYSGAGLLLALLAGCASPGPPLPPTLKLPEIATGLTVTRVAGQVMLHWTTPTHTTDKLLIQGPVTAEICRDVPAAAPARPVAAGRSAGKPAATPCVVAVRVQVAAGASEATDTLSEELALGPARLLAYRVQLKNAAGRTAGPSAAVLTAAGAAPGPVEELHGTAVKGGVVLEWRPQVKLEPGEAVELERTTLPPPTEAPAVGATAATASRRSSGVLGQPKEPAVSQFRVSGSDPDGKDTGGTIDRTVSINRTYRYVAQRVRTVALGGQTLELRGAPSAAVQVPVSDMFPPDAPTGLVTVPGFADEGEAQRTATSPATGPATRPAIDLSWDPNMEARIAGYRVYRRDAEGGEWKLLDAEPVRVTAYRDLTVAAGKRYAYRVTALSEAGLESAPGVEAMEMAPIP